MTGRIVLVQTSPRVAPGQLTLEAWDVLRAGPACHQDPAHPQLAALAAAGIELRSVAGPPLQQARALRDAARPTGTASWLLSADGDPELRAALGAAEFTGTPITTVTASHDLPGARLLDVVRVMDTLRSPGGCPWDAQQTHASLARYLLEEAYEALEAIEHGDEAALEEELGDVLLQVVFHARIAEESEAGWNVDDLAAGLVDKLVRRHPHVFAPHDPRAGASTPAEVEANWDEIKKAEKGRSSVTEGVPMGQPALALAAKLQSRAARTGTATPLAAAAAADALSAAVAAARDDAAPDPHEQIGELLFAAVELARARDVDPEAALRAAARRFRDRLLAAGR